MYTKPELVKYGTFRDLTLIGFGADGDGGISFLDNAIDGCWPIPNGACLDDRS